MPTLLAMIPKHGLPFPGMRPGQLSTFEVGRGKFADWRVHVRGPQVFLESPPGWQVSGAIDRTSTKRRVFELPRNEVFLCWDKGEDDDLRDFVNWSPPEARDPIAAPNPMPGVLAETDAEARALSAPIVETVTRTDNAPTTIAPPPEGDEPDPDDDDDLPTTAPAKRGRGR